MFIAQCFKDIIELLLPRYCLLCGKRLAASDRHICPTCLGEMFKTRAVILEENPVERLFWSQLNIVRATSFLFFHASDTRAMIHRAKYDEHPEMGSFLAEIAARELRKEGFFDGIDAIVPVPLHWRRCYKRGYNQSNYIARAISRVTGIRVETRAMKRKRNNRSQTQLSLENRKRNVEGIFELCRPERVRGRHVLVVDDVMTSGSTVMSTAKELEKAGDVRISIFTLAYAGRIFAPSQENAGVSGSGGIFLT